MESRKLFIGGLPMEAQAEELREHFGRYGEVLRVRVVRHHESGQCRGFAFVEFADEAAARAALDEEEKPIHVLCGRTVDVKRARARQMQNQTEQLIHPHHASQSPVHSQWYNANHSPVYSQWYNANQSPVHSQWYNQSSSNNTNAGIGIRSCDRHKVFVGGLRDNITKEDLKSYFEKFGKMTDVVVIHDGVTHKSRGFGFITFDSEEAVKKVMETNFHELNGIKVETKIAIPKDRSYYQDRQQYGSGTWGGSSSPRGYHGMYPQHNMPYIINNPYMIPLQQYMYSTHATGGYGYMANESATSNFTTMMARQGAPMMYTGYGAPFGYNPLGTNGVGVYSVDVGSDSRVSQVLPNRQQVDTPTVLTEQEPLNSESNNLP